MQRARHATLKERYLMLDARCVTLTTRDGTTECRRPHTQFNAGRSTHDTKLDARRASCKCRTRKMNVEYEASRVERRASSDVRRVSSGGECHRASNVTHAHAHRVSTAECPVLSVARRASSVSIASNVARRASRVELRMLGIERWASRVEA
jgi:hypothetical protein